MKLVERLQGYTIIIASVTPFFTKEFFEHKDELLLISRHGIGYNNIDLDAAKQHDTIVSIIPALVERDAVAENNVTNLLAVLRQTVAADERILSVGRYLTKLWVSLVLGTQEVVSLRRYETDFAVTC